MSARIVVIEDNPANLDLMTYLLRAFKYEPLCALDGEQGLALVRKERPEVVICDLQLPRMDGFEVRRRLKEDPATAAIPVIAVTAFAMVGDRDRVLRAGFDGYIGKPIVPETFVSQVEQFVGEKPERPVAPSSSVPAAPAKAAATGARILVVDNTLGNREFMSSVLESASYAVRTASNVRQALAIFRSWKPELIVSDLHMPGEGGLELLKHVREDDAGRRVRFIVSSVTSGSPAHQREALALGADAFLLQPSEPDAILAEVAALLSRKGS